MTASMPARSWRTSAAVRRGPTAAGRPCRRAREGDRRSPQVSLIGAVSMHNAMTRRRSIMAAIASPPARRPPACGAADAHDRSRTSSMDAVRALSMSRDGEAVRQTVIGAAPRSAVERVASGQRVAALRVLLGIVLPRSPATARRPAGHRVATRELHSPLWRCGYSCCRSRRCVARCSPISSTEAQLSTAWPSAMATCTGDPRGPR